MKNRPKRAEIGSNWAEREVKNGRKWLKMAKDGQKCQKMAENVQK